MCCWYVGEEIRICGRYFESGAVDKFISDHRIYSPEPVVDENGVRLSDASMLPMLGNPLFMRPILTNSGDVVITLKGDNADINEFKKLFARSE